MRFRWMALLIGISAFFLNPVRAGDEAPPCPLVTAVKPAAMKSTENDDLVGRLNKQRLRAAVTELDYRYKELCDGRGTHEGLFRSIDRVVNAAADVLPDPADRLAILEAALRTARDVEGRFRGWFAAHKTGEIDVAVVEYHRATAEVRVLRLKLEIDKAKK